MKIAIAVDLSEESAAATRWALDLRDHLHDSAQPVQAVAISIAPSGWYSMDRSSKTTDDPGVHHRLVTQIRSFLQEVDLDVDDVEVFVDEGPTAELVAEYCDTYDIDLLVTGRSAHGAMGRFLWGSTIHDLVDRVQCAVAVVHPDFARLHQDIDLLVGIDFLPGSDNALLRAAEFASLTDASLHLVHALPDAPASNLQTGLINYISSSDLAHFSADARHHLESLVEDLRHQYPDLIYTTTVLSGTPASVLINSAEERNADVVILGNIHHSGLEQWLLGSAGQKILKTMPRTLLFVPPD